MASDALCPTCACELSGDGWCWNCEVERGGRSWVAGHVECAVCGRTHLSVHAVVSERLECPVCGYMTPNPDHAPERGPTR